MIVIKHKKIGDISYVSHIDCMRLMQRAIRRTGVKVNYSNGFNPHMQVYSTHPLPLGVQSVAEYLMVDVDDVSAEDFLALYNRSVPTGLQGISAIELNSKPKLVASVNVIEYTVKLNKELPHCVENIPNDEEYYIEFTKKGELVRKKTFGALYFVKVDGERLSIGVGTGNNSLRPHEVIRKICSENHVDVCLNDIFRTRQYIFENGKYLDADSYLEECKKGLRR